MSQIDDFLAGKAAQPAQKSQIDTFLDAASPPSRGFKGWAGDALGVVARGAISVPEAAVGLLDIPTGGAVGKALENEGGSVGLRFKQAKEAASDLFDSDATKQQNQQFQQADGIVEKAKVALSNPSMVVRAVGESVPSMVAGGVAARGLMAATKLGQMGAAGAALAGAAGEGLTAAGSAAEQIRQETPDGLLTPTQAALAAGTGVATAGFGVLGGRVANKLGIGDAETMLAQGTKGMAKQNADDAATAAVNPLVQQAAAKSIPRRVIEGAISEGFLEELPQSVAEQIFQNVALGKDWLTDVDSAAVMGVLSGGAMGGAASGYHGFKQPKAEPGASPSDQPGAAPTDAGAAPPNPGMERIQQAFAAQLAALQQQEQGDPNVPQTAPPDGAAALAQQQAQAAEQRQAAMDASRAVQSPDDEIYQSTGATVPRSVAMGLDPAAGPLSASAALAVDTGASDQVQQAAALAQAAEVAQKQVKKPAQGNQKQEQPALTQQGVNQETGEISQGSPMESWSDAQLSSTFRGAQSREVRMQLAQELGRRRALREQQELQAELDAEQRASVPGAERADAAFASLTEDAGPVPADLTIPATTEGNRNGPQAAQAQQGSAQPSQVGAAPAVALGAPDAQGRPGANGAQQAAAAGLTDGAPTANPGAQAAPAPGPEAQAPSGKVEALRQQLRDVESKILGASPAAMGQGGGDIEAAMKSRKVPVTLKAQRKKLVDQVRAAQEAEVKTFAPETGTLGIPREEMPQVPTQSHGGLVKHLNAQGIAHETTTVNAADLKPTQAEYSPAKVEAAKAATGDRAVIVSSDGHVIDGHHQAMAAAEEGKPVKAIVLDAPVEQALEAVKNSPSALGNEENQAPATANTASVATKSEAKTKAYEAAPAAPPVPKKAASRGILAKKAAAEEAARAEYFAPGNIVKSYGGHDRVVSYLPSDQDGRWSVTVRQVRPQDGKWVDVPGLRERTHATMPDGRELKAGPVQRAQPLDQSQRFGAGKALTKDERKAVLNSLVDVYKAKGAPRELKGIGRDGNERTGYVHSPDLFEKSDITGAMVRYYVTLPDGRRAHPTELFPEYTQADIDAELEKQRSEERAKANEVKRLTDDRYQFGSREEAEAYWDDRSAKSLRTAAGLPTIFAALDRTLLTDGQKFVLVPDSTIKQPGMAEAFADAGWSKPDRAIAAMETPQSRAAPESAVQVQEPAPSPTESSEPTDRITDFGEKIGGARKDQAATKGTKAARPRSTDERPAWARRFEISQIAKSSRLGEEGRWVVRDTRSLDAFKQPRRMGRETFATREEAEQAVPLLAVAQKHRVVPARGEGAGYEIWRDVNDRKRVKVVDQVFTTRELAVEYMAAHAQEIIETNTTFGEADLPRPPSEVRTGAERRTGDARDSDFMDVFGFRGVEFGNWNNQQERQQLLNDAYDGLLDLADVMGVPPRAISLNGELALAFGARGHGLSGARAHYELDKVVINLTKMNGAGSLAHEWFHALDHYFGRQDGKAPAEWVVAKDGTRALQVHDAPEDDMASGGTRGERSGMRPELREAFTDVMRTIARKAEAYVEDTARADRFVAAAREEVKRRLDSIRADLARDLDTRYYKRHNKAATADQLAEFDSVAEKVVAGEALELRVESKGSGRSISAGIRWTNDALNRLSAVMKAVRGRQGFSADQDGPLDRLRGVMQNYSARLKMLADAQDATEKSRAVPTEFVMNAKELDQGRGQDYWTRPHELAARAFQGYVEDKIAERGGRSPFLNYAPENAAIPTPWGFKRPFPAGAERVAINKSLDKLVDVIQTRESENGGVALFRREDEGRTTPFDVDTFLKAMGSQSAYSEAAQRQAIDSVSATVDAIRAAWGPNAPEVVVAFDMQDQRIPEAARKADLRQRSGGARGAPEGFYYRGKAYLMASRLNTPNDAARVLYHEVLGHHGLRGKFGRDLDQVLNQIATMRKAEVAAKMREYGLRGVNSLSVREAAEEVLAEMAEKNPQLPFVQRAISAIRNFLRQHVPGFQSLRLTDNDIIQAYILPARGWVVRGGPDGDPGGGLGFSRADETPLRPASTFTEAREAAQEFQGKALTNEATGLRANVSRNTLDKMLSRKAVEKSASAQAQSRAVANLDRLYQDAIFGWSKEDRDGNTNVRAVHRFFVPMAMDGRMLMAKLTVKETVDANHANPLYTVEAVDFNEKSPAAVWVDASAKADGIDLTSIRSARDVLSLAQEIEQRNAEDDGGALFSRSKMADIGGSAMGQLQEAMTHPGKVSLWDKTVGTMRNLAERSPVFKPVYEAAQRFIDDVSMLGNDAADRAPRLLPRVETLADLKKKPITAADNQAVAKPLFEGTLLWARDVDGTPVTTEALNAKYRNTTPDEKAQILLRTGKIQEQMLKAWRGLPVDQYNTIINNKFDSTILKPGVVWTEKELKNLFDLSAEQVSLYQEARAAIDRSIDMTARADMLRALGAGYAGLREAVLAQASAEDAMVLITDTLQAEARELPDQADRILSLNNAVVKSYERAKALMDAGYAPLSRFGRYTVDVVGKDGTREYFGMFESMYESNKMKAAMEKEFPGATVTQGTMSDEAFKLFQGITPESLEHFGQMLGLSGEGSDPKDKAFQAYLQLAKNNHSALKRLIHRKGISGYSEDVGRVLASFVYSNARLAAGGLNAGTLETAIEGIPKEQGELRDVAMGLRSYIQDPQEEGQAVRGMLFAQYLGGSVASAMVNMTQPFQITMPWLSQFGGLRSAASHLAGAVRDMTRRTGYEPDLAKALQTAEAEGIVSPQEIHQLMAQARGAGSLRTGDGTKLGDARAAAANNWERVKVAWGQPFALAEQFNRRSTFIAAYRIAKEQGMADPAKFAERAVQETQFVYSKANKPKWARGTIGGTLFTFKTYSVSYLELMHRMWSQGGPEGKRAVGWAVAMLLLMGGAGGLPFMEDAEDLIDGAGQLMGYNISTKHWRKQALRDVVGKELADFMEQGVSGLPGAPIDVSGRLGMGNLIPGTGLLLAKQNRERDLLEVAGPAGDLVARGFTGARKLLTGDVAGAALEVSPAAVRNAAKGIDMGTSGIYKDAKGYKVIDTTLDEAIAKAIGFQPKSVAEVQEANSFMQRSKSFYIQTSSDIKAQWAQAVFEKDDTALQRVRDRLAAWNRNNPDQPILAKIPDVMKRVREMGKDRTQRIEETAPKALRSQMREMARENG
ncbi:PLxRFG domain-containing protein [Acidovorax sp. ACV02]|uniref:PLxRFG domain-containing protein n=1 Tax=Acidovorax sp. ACV02 TaxID=2769310 RepID=UPI00177EBF67|nr:PLxRFG domain-containing protein [Acidovorax sp. ACV02]MBD9406299.1 PLxRFG domain-containing protein [Acidovorax sp. ACV02]